jgi:hypothetical protein
MRRDFLAAFGKLLRTDLGIINIALVAGLQGGERLIRRQRRARTGRRMSGASSSPESSSKQTCGTQLQETPARDRCILAFHAH